MARIKIKSATFIGFVLICLVGPLSCGQAPQAQRTSMAELQIFRGTAAAAGEQSWTVALVQSGMSYPDAHLCGGVLINPNFVLTAAHCLLGLEQTQIEIIAGLKDLSRINDRGQTHKYQRRKVSKIDHFGQYNEQTHQHDIALLQLDHELKSGRETKVINIFTDSQDPEIGRVSGWGGTEKYPISPHLQSVDLPIVSQDECKKTYPDLKSSMICAGFKQGKKDACFGDSGGPLTHFDPHEKTWSLLGIVSFAHGCAQPHTPGVYTRVAFYNQWIKGVIGKSGL